MTRHTVTPRDAGMLPTALTFSRYLPIVCSGRTKADVVEGEQRMTRAASSIALVLLAILVLSACASAPLDSYGRSSRQDDVLFCVQGGGYTPEKGY